MYLVLSDEVSFWLWIHLLFIQIGTEGKKKSGIWGTPHYFYHTHTHTPLFLIFCQIIIFCLLVPCDKVSQETTEVLDLHNNSLKAYLASAVLKEKNRACQMGCIKMIITLNEINPKDYYYGIGWLHR